MFGDPSWHRMARASLLLFAIACVAFGWSIAAEARVLAVRQSIPWFAAGAISIAALAASFSQNAVLRIAAALVGVAAGMSLCAALLFWLYALFVFGRP